MHLHSLELIGFKSFADKTLFEFHEGVTAIVGPNGCGKSNVLDAVRWVLGEQSAKALRGGEMADVIFNGTDTRKPVGFGEVSLTFTNCGSELGVDWHDVRVTRRVYRDGNSEYFLNKTPCRLRDIQALFADTGVGRSAYSIMEQGKIDLILSSRPEDRRTVFEEAAGITKYKTQKKEALRKLEATEANLLRIGDIIKEVKRQIGSLQRQAGKARRYQTLHADLQVLDTHHSRRQLDTLEAEAEHARTEMGRLQDAEQEAHAKIEASENDLSAKRRSLDEVDGEIGDARAEVQRLQSEMAGLRNRIEFNEQRAQEIGELIERYISDISAAEARRSEQASQLEEADALIARTNQLLVSKEREVHELTELLRAARMERTQKEDELQALQSSLSKLENRIASLQTDLSGMTARRDATSGRIAELTALVSGANGDLAAARSNLGAARAALETERQTAEQRKESLRQAEERLHQNQAAVAQTDKEITRLERTVAEKQARLEVLRQMTEEGHGLEKGSQAVLKGLDDPERIRPVIAGALVASLKVDSEFVPALEAAFGRNMHAVILRETKLATDIFQKLADQKLGQAALAITGLSGSPVEASSEELPEGAVAWAVDKVEAPAELAGLVTNLLRGVAIVPDLNQGLKLKEGARDLQFATLGGEFISRHGIIFGGTSSSASDSMLGRKVIITGLEDETQALESERAGALAARDEAKEQVESASGAADEARQTHQSAQEKSSQTGVEILSAERAVADEERKLAQLETEKSTLEQQVRSADDRVAEIERELQADRKNLENEQALQRTAEQTRGNARAREEEMAEKLNDLRLAVATERQRHESLVHHREPMAAREAELADLIAARRGDIATYQERRARQARESEQAEARMHEQAVELERAEQNAAALAEQRSARHAVVSEQETHLRALRNSLNDLRDSRGKEEVLQTQLQLRVENLVEHVMRRYHVNLREFAADSFAFQKTLSVLTKQRAKTEDGGSSPATAGPLDANDGGDAATTEASPAERPIHLEADLEQIIAELTRQLDNMGPVNLDAVHEYDELEERYRFLETQNNDLVSARREVLDVIARINSTTQKLFADTFAQVRINFGEMFAEMFGGGRADLSLQDENDPLNCGIEISAKPPGKQLQNVSLLSGGERTMTAVSLLFAIYMVRPSPFCILDEMDAPLDESNINRFIKVLDRFVSQSQFIIITHNKRTIAKADVLYGVTMEERGVSKLVGMKLSADRGSDGELRRSASNGNGNGAASRERTGHQGQFALAGEGDDDRRVLASRR
ncbi:MAG TPA: chromosome segregation protein SMC [Chthoniobacterales bacterium]|nr:chromosome segregation protein SMC [Chthoniobacterales bacterium]